jgi:hypothetical protein
MILGSQKSNLPFTRYYKIYIFMIGYVSGAHPQDTLDTLSGAHPQDCFWGKIPIKFYCD